MSDIIDDIDALVDDQLAGGEPRSGFDYGDPTYPKCPHCERHWHGLPLTERVAAMYSAGHFDEDYRADQDDSPVLCEGSEFIGPMRPPRRRSGNWSFGGQQLLSIMAVPDDERIDWAAWFGAYLGWPDMYLPISDDPPLETLETFVEPRYDLATVQIDEATGIYTFTISGSTFITGPHHHENRRLPLRLEDV
jgi:hypothetical protein